MSIITNKRSNRLEKILLEASIYVRLKSVKNIKQDIRIGKLFNT